MTMTRTFFTPVALLLAVCSIAMGQEHYDAIPADRACLRPTGVIVGKPGPPTIDLGEVKIEPFEGLKIELANYDHLDMRITETAGKDIRAISVQSATSGGINHYEEFSNLVHDWDGTAVLRAGQTIFVSGAMPSPRRRGNAASIWIDAVAYMDGSGVGPNRTNLHEGLQMHDDIRFNRPYRTKLGRVGETNWASAIEADQLKNYVYHTSPPEAARNPPQEGEDGGEEPHPWDDTPTACGCVYPYNCPISSNPAVGPYPYIPPLNSFGYIIPPYLQFLRADLYGYTCAGINAGAVQDNCTLNLTTPFPVYPLVPSPTSFLPVCRESIVNANPGVGPGTQIQCSYISYVGGPPGSTNPELVCYPGKTPKTELDDYIIDSTGCDGGSGCQAVSMSVLLGPGVYGNTQLLWSYGMFGQGLITFPPPNTSGINCMISDYTMAAMTQKGCGVKLCPCSGNPGGGGGCDGTLNNGVQTGIIPNPCQPPR